MSKSLSIAGALLALATFATTADARMMGGMSTPSSMSRGDSHAPMSSSLGATHGFSPDGRGFGATGQSFSHTGLETRVNGWKKPIDSDGGGPADPQPKPPKTQTPENSGNHDPYGRPLHPYGASWWYHHHHHYGE